MNRRDRRASQHTDKASQTLLKLVDEAVSHHQAGRWAEAEALYKRVLTLHPNSADVNSNLASVLQKQNRDQEALDYFNRAMRLNPGNAGTHNNLANLFRKIEQFDQAETFYLSALSLNPALAEAHNNYGSMLRNLGRRSEALDHFRQAVALRPNYAEAYNGLANVLSELGRDQDAVEYYHKAIEILPKYAEAYNGLGNALKNMNRLDEAMTRYRQAIEIDPDFADPHWGLAYTELLQGDFENGWPRSRWRTKLKAVTRPFSTEREWDGQPLIDKTILLYTEQGLGDAIQFIRYAPLVKSLGATVIVLCPPSLEKLFRTVAGLDGVYTDPAAIPAYDYHASLMNLPIHIRANAPYGIPSHIPYIHPDPAETDLWRQRLAGYPGKRIGIAWRGNPAHKNDHNRSLHAEKFLEFLRVPGISIINLQKDARPEELERFDAQTLLNAVPMLNDLADTAALIGALDLVITVDTSICHLAGSIGADTWVLLPFAPDWRWLAAREDDTPWYPTMRLFRQQRAGDWQSVCENLFRSLQD